MKHAYLIIAHNEIYVLRKLISFIDDERNDIYLLIDKKVKDKEYYQLHTKKSNLYYCDGVKIYWGHENQIKAELILFESAWKNGPYMYYHLLSGVCLPIKSQNYIHEFCRKHCGTQFVGFLTDSFSYLDIERKTRYYHFFVSNFAKPNLFFRITRLQGILYKIQRLIGIKRNYDNMILQKGCNWISVTNDFVDYLMQKKKWIIKHFHHVLCGDEIFIQTILWNSRFRYNIYDIDNCYRSAMREIIFQGWHPLTITINDYDRLKNSECFFARKFSSKNKDIIDKVSELINNSQK